MKPADPAGARSRKRAAASRKRFRQASSVTTKADAKTKQSRVIAMLRRPVGATVAAVMAATGWQPHTVRAFLARVIRGRLGLALVAEKSDGERIYRIRDGRARKRGGA